MNKIRKQLEEYLRVAGTEYFKRDKVDIVGMSTISALDYINELREMFEKTTDEQLTQALTESNYFQFESRELNLDWLPDFLEFMERVSNYNITEFSTTQPMHTIWCGLMIKGDEDKQGINFVSMFTYLQLSVIRMEMDDYISLLAEQYRNSFLTKEVYMALAHDVADVIMGTITPIGVEVSSIEELNKLNTNNAAKGQELFTQIKNKALALSGGDNLKPN